MLDKKWYDLIFLTVAFALWFILTSFSNILGPEVSILLFGIILIVIGCAIYFHIKDDIEEKEIDIFHYYASLILISIISIITIYLIGRELTSNWTFTIYGWIIWTIILFDFIAMTFPYIYYYKKRKEK